MGSLCLFTRQQAFKIGYFYWLRIKNSRYLHAVFSLGYLRNANFYLESKASFIDISIIVLFKLFFIAWLREYCTFSDSSVVSITSSPWPKYTQLGTIFQKISCSTIKLFFFFKYVLCKSVLSKHLEKNWGSPYSFKRKGEFISLSSLV